MGSAQPANASRLRDEGFCVIPQLLDPPMLAALRAATDAELEAQPAEHFERFRHHGSMLAVDWRDRLMQRLITWPATLRALAELGFGDPKWLSGYVISKPPRSPALWWHQDWWAWREPDSFAPDPPQLFVMFYLRDVSEQDGCLRVIPGSHRRAHSLHERLPEAHGTEIADSDVALAQHEDEVSVPVRAGDAVIGDVRLLHATHANESDDRRTLLTLWYLPTFERLGEPLKAYLMQHPSLPGVGWWKRSDGIPRPLRERLPVYDGSAPPAQYCRQPPPQWLQRRRAMTRL
jgi:hypothetical protein